MTKLEARTGIVKERKARGIDRYRIPKEFDRRKVIPGYVREQVRRSIQIGNTYRYVAREFKISLPMVYYIMNPKKHEEYLERRKQNKKKPEPDSFKSKMKSRNNRAYKRYLLEKGYIRRKPKRVKDDNNE